MAEDEGTSRLHAVIGGFKRLQEKGLLCQPSPPNFEWRWSPDSGIGAFALRDIEPLPTKPGAMIQVSEMEKGIIYATKACISFGGEESFAQGPLLKKKQKEDKEAKLMLRNSMALYHRDVKKDEREAEKKRFQDTGRAVFSFFLRKFSANPDPWMDEYTKMLPQPDGSIGKEYGGVGGVGFVYELGEEVLKEKFRGTSAEFSSVYTFARAYATVIRKSLDMGKITKVVLEPQNLTLEQYVLYIISQCESRTFQGHGWIPFIDFVNGTMSEPVVNMEKVCSKINFKGEVVDQGIWHVLRVTRPVKKGEELIIDYGSTFSDHQKILLKYGTPDITGFAAGHDAVSSVRLDIAQVYPSFLPLQKEFLMKHGMFGEKEAKVGVWLSFPPPPFINLQVVEPADPFIRQLAITVSVTDPITLENMVRTGRLRVPHLSIDDLINSLRAFISASLAGPTFRKQSTEHFVSVWNDTSLPYADRCAARMKASEREALLVWDRTLCRALPPIPHPELRPKFALMDNIKRCAACGRSFELFRCTRCKRVRYCGARCQKGDWKRHKKECGIE